MIEKMGVWTVAAIVAAIVVSYSLFGAASIKASQHSSPFGAATAQIFTANM